MREIDKYGILKEKLTGICEENSLTYSIQDRKHPFLMIVKPVGGVDAQQTMMEGMDNPGDTGYISPDASLVFAYRDGVLTYKISETFTISDSLFSKIKNKFKQLHDMWMQFFFRYVLENNCLPSGTGTTDATEPGSVEPESAEAAETTEDAFADFLAEAEPAEEETETDTDTLDDNEAE